MSLMLRWLNIVWNLYLIVQDFRVLISGEVLELAPSILNKNQIGQEKHLVLWMKMSACTYHEPIWILVYEHISKYQMNMSIKKKKNPS